MKSRSWLVVVGLTLLGVLFLTSGFIARLEQDQLFVLEKEMLSTAQAMIPVAGPVLSQPDSSLDKLRETVITTQNATGSRIRILGPDRQLVVDSLSGASNQLQLRFRPEIQAAYTGNYGAYTRYSDETERSLALFVAIPLNWEGERVGAVYVSHSTDEILQQLGVFRRIATRVVVGLAGALFLAAVLMTGRVRETLSQLRSVTGRVSDSRPENLPEVKGGREVAEIRENFNRLIDSLREKISELEAEKAKTKRFLEEVAHELKTPMTGLMGSLETLRNESLEAEDSEKMWKNLQREAERLSDLTSSLLELQKLDYTEIKLEPFDLLSVAETVTDSFHALAAKKGLSLEVQECEDSLALGDARKIQRVVENLVENALRCSPSGGAVIIRLDRSPERTRLSVVDCGPGPPDPECFKRYKRGEQSPGSLGLGLSIAWEILKKHESALVMEKRPEGGSVFSFELPTPN